MFKIEIIDLLNKIKNSNSEYELNNLKKSLKNLINQNIDDYNNFKSEISGDENSINSKILKTCEIEIEKEKNNLNINNNNNNVDNKNNNLDNDSQIFKECFSKFLNLYKQNNNQINDECKNLIESLVKLYFPKRVEVIFDMLKIVDSSDFEVFKNVIENTLKIYYLEKVDSYLKSEKYEKLWFFKKSTKKMDIMRLVNNITMYKFNPKKIAEVLEENE